MIIRTSLQKEGLPLWEENDTTNTNHPVTGAACADLTDITTTTTSTADAADGVAIAATGAAVDACVEATFAEPSWPRCRNTLPMVMKLCVGWRR